MRKDFMWDDGIDDNFYDGYRNRLITTEEINCEINRIVRKEKRFYRLRKMRSYFKKKIGNSCEKFTLYVLKDIMLKEMEKPYYNNASHVLEFIDINSHMAFTDDGMMYHHVENLCIWQNGFYQFYSFNSTTPTMRYAKSNSFNEEMTQELEELNSHEKLVPIDSGDQGTKEDYAKLEAKILKMSKQHESYTE